jgi:hypothetical protein
MQQRSFKVDSPAGVNLTLVHGQKVDYVKRCKPQQDVAAACFQRDRGFGFQPNVKRAHLIMESL